MRVESTPRIGDFVSLAYPLSRRHALQLIGTSGALALAGCSRSDEASDSGSSFTVWTAFNGPPLGTYNGLGGVANSLPQDLAWLCDYVLLPGAMYKWKEQSYYYLLADDSTALSSDGTTLTYRVRPNQEWSDGAPITANDVYATWMCRYVIRHPAYDYIDSVEQTDDMTVTFHINAPAPIAQYYILRERIVAESQFDEFVSEAESLMKRKADSTDIALTKLAKKISGYKPDDVLASGPYTIDTDSVSHSQLTLRKNDRSWVAKKVHFDTVVIYGSFDFSTVIPIILQKRLDYTTGGPPPAVEKTLKEKGLRILRGPIYSGPALYFNYAKLPEFADKRARQALCYAFDHEQNGQVALGESGKELRYYAGVSDVMIPTWLTPAGQQKLIQYTFDLQKATTLLTAAGWTKTAGTWHTPQGRPAAYDLLYPADYPDWNAAASNLASQLSDFGINLTRRGVESTQAGSYVEDGKFTLAVMGWGASNPFPADSYRAALIDLNTPGLGPDKKGMDFPMRQHTDAVGDVDLEEVVKQTGFGTTTEELKTATTTAALAFNELLPIIPLWERYANCPLLDEAVVGCPPDGDPLYDNSIYADNYITILTFEGTLKPA